MADLALSVSTWDSNKLFCLVKDADWSFAALSSSLSFMVSCWALDFRSKNKKKLNSNISFEKKFNFINRDETAVARGYTHI